MLKDIDDSIAKAAAEIERMAPNMKAVDRWVLLGVFPAAHP